MTKKSSWLSSNWSTTPLAAQFYRQRAANRIHECCQHSLPMMGITTSSAARSSDVHNQLGTRHSLQVDAELLDHRRPQRRGVLHDDCKLLWRAGSGLIALRDQILLEVRRLDDLT